MCNGQKRIKYDRNWFKRIKKIETDGKDRNEWKNIELDRKI